jgi:hypothetical protein
VDDLKKAFHEASKQKKVRVNARAFPAPVPLAPTRSGDACPRGLSQVVPNKTEYYPERQARAPRRRATECVCVLSMRVTRRQQP